MTTPVKPVLPKGTITEITVADGESLGVLAERYHTTVASIMELNGISNPNLIRANQKLKVSAIADDAYNKYQEALKLYDRHIAEEKEKAEIAKRTELAIKKIDKAKKDGYADKYSFAINDKGHVIITLKDATKLGDIREDFNLDKGMLLATNPSIEQRYKTVKAYRRDETTYDTYDYAEAKKGDTFVLDTNSFSTERTWSQFFKDILPF